MTTATLNKEDVKKDIAAALSLCMAIDLVAVNGHDNCPFRKHETAKKAVNGLARLLKRLECSPSAP